RTCAAKDWLGPISPRGWEERRGPGGCNSRGRPNEFFVNWDGMLTRMNESLSPKSTLSEPPIRSKDFAEELARLWELGQSPDVYSFLAQTGPLLAVEVAAVLREDQRQRWHAGEPISVESYLQAVPQLRADREALVDLIFNEFLQSEKHGQKPTVASYQGRFPE